MTRRAAKGDVFGKTLQPYQKHDGGCSAPGPVGDRAREGAEMGAETECAFCACSPTSKNAIWAKSVAVKSLNEPVLKLLIDSGEGRILPLRRFTVVKSKITHQYTPSTLFRQAVGN